MGDHGCRCRLGRAGYDGMKSNRYNDRERRSATMGVRHIESAFRQHSGGSLGKREGYHTPAFEEDGWVS